MSNQKDRRSTTDQILDLLLDALAERQRTRRQETATGRPPTHVSSVSEASPPADEKPPAPPEKPSPSAVPPPRPEPPPSERRLPAAPQAPARPAQARSTPPPPPVRERQPVDEGWEPPPPQPSIHMGKTMGRLLVLVGFLVVLFNVPVTRYGVSLARIMPEASSLIIRDGLVLKGSGPEIYMLEADKLRWISSLDAFDHLGLTWKDVHVVEDSFLAKFEQGRPIHVLLKCNGSPHIYRLENNQKRWIKDIDTFLAEGHVWEDVRFVTCQYLRDIPDGPPIPEDAGPPPQP
jgi:hypothetical protein